MFSLSYRRLRGDMIGIFKFVHGQSTGYLSGMFEFDDKARGRGYQFRLVVKQSRTRLRQSFLIEELWDIRTSYQQKMFQSLHLGPLTFQAVGRGHFLPPLVFFIYLLNRFADRHQTFSTLPSIAFAHCDQKIFQRL